MEAAVNVYFITVSSLSALLYFKSRVVSGERSEILPSELVSLQWLYLPAHLLALFSDWLQGPYVYQLYRQYGYTEADIAVLFMAGYLSSCLLGSTTGPLADRYGRRTMGQVFCAICILNCASKLSHNFYLLLAGRFLSGVSTSCLYSVFESWYVSEHRSRGLEMSLVSSTMALLTTFNSLLAISAGLVSDLMVRQLELPVLAPFLAAIPCLGLSCLLMSGLWTENYGSQAPVLSNYRQGWRIIWNNSQIIKLGLIQSCVESSMFIFVYLWTPTLSAGLSKEDIPLGKIFSTFMMSIMLGSMLFKQSSRGTANILIRTILLILACNLAAALTADGTEHCPFMRQVAFISFIGLELGLGLYFPALATLRSLHIPESHRSTIINLFRIPLNVITITVLLGIKSGAIQSRGHVFTITSVLLGLASFTAYRLTACEERQKAE